MQNENDILQLVGVYCLLPIEQVWLASSHLRTPLLKGHDRSSARKANQDLTRQAQFRCPRLKVRKPRLKYRESVG